MFEKLNAIPWMSHMIRAVKRFNERMGSQFGAAITYFSFLSLIPIVMLSFAAAGFMLASNPTLMDDLINKIVSSVSSPTLVQTLKDMVKTAVRQRTTVGISGILLAFYSGLSWMGSLREAVCAQTRDVWERNTQNDFFLINYVKDFIALIGLMFTLAVSVSLTSLAGTAQASIVSSLRLNDVTWMHPVLTVTAIVISVSANFLMFLWIYWVLPRQRSNSVRVLFKGALLAAVGFEALKVLMTYILPLLAKSPSGVMFGSVVGLMAFFYFFARLTLFGAAWIATAPANCAQLANTQSLPAQTEQDVVSSLPVGPIADVKRRRKNKRKKELRKRGK